MISFWIIVAIAVIVWIGVIVYNADGFLFTALFPGLLGGAMIAACIFIVMLVATPTMRAFTGYHWNYFNVPIVALTDERSDTGGAFFLGSGLIGTHASYVFYAANDDGARVMQQVDAENVKVYEDSATPYARYLNQRVLDHPEWVPLAGWFSHTPTLVELHVPPHSIKTGINMGVSGG